MRRELADSEYNVRREQCEKGVNILSEKDNSVESLRDVSLELLAEHKKAMDPVIYKRCKYVIEENQRVENACMDLQKGDIQSFGQRMYESHRGLSEKYEVSCSELDVLVEEASRIEGVLGSRMMGGGFGGCTINLVYKDYIPAFSNQIKTKYQKRLKKSIKTYKTRIANGATFQQVDSQLIKD